VRRSLGGTLPLFTILKNNDLWDFRITPTEKEEGETFHDEGLRIFDGRTKNVEDVYFREVIIHRNLLHS
jgi:hypothetical protein